MSTPRLRDTGVLVYPPIDYAEGLALDYRVSAEQLRFFLTYFDQVCLVPLNSPDLGFFCSTEEEQRALHQGLVTGLRPRLVAVGEPGENWLLGDFSRVFRIANGGDQGRWALAAPAGMKTDAEVESWNAATLTIRDLLPAPSQDVPLAEVIGFRVDHRTELQRMHEAIDSIFLSLRFEDPDNRDLAVKRLKEEIDLVERAVAKASFPYAKVGLSVSKALESSLPGLLELAGAAIGAPAGAGSFLGGAVTLAARKSSLARKSNRYPEDFEYVYLGSKRRVLPTGEVLQREAVYDVQPTVCAMSIFSSYLPLLLQTMRPNGGGNTYGATVADEFAVSKAELGEFFEGWAEYAPDDPDKSLDAGAG